MNVNLKNILNSHLKRRDNTLKGEVIGLTLIR